MTVEEAIQKAQLTRHCFVFWDINTGEVLDVVGFDRDPTPMELLPCLERIPDGFPGHEVAGRSLPSKQLTPAAFLVNGPDVQERIDWYDRTAEESFPRIVEMLEQRDYPPVIAEEHGAGHLVKTLTGFRRGELTPDLIARLRVLARGEAPGKGRSLSLRDRLKRWASLKDSAWLETDARHWLLVELAVLDRDATTLLALWRGKVPGIGFAGAGSNAHLTRSLGDLRVTDPQAIESLIRSVQHTRWFEDRYAAMLALGRIGPPAGERAAETIRTSIYDSSPQVAALRGRACARILAPEGAWHECPDCDRGRVPAVRRDKSSWDYCPRCYELAWLPPGA